MTKRNGNEVNVKVISVADGEVTYRLSGDDSGPLRSISTSELFRIKKADGTVIVFDSTRPDTPPPPTPPITPYHKGYVGLGLGTAVLLPEYTDIKSNGLQFNVNAGYLFKKHIGITASFLLTSYKMTSYTDAKVGLRGGFAGPLIAFQNSSQKVEYDIRPTVGFVSGKLSGENISLKTENITFALGVGGSVRFNVSDFISLTSNLDMYFHGDFDESTVLTLKSLSSVGVSIGVNFRF
ncbi:MAG: hypothetical protein LBK58_03165 [Prevotellaceae bacterium]|nr:hypothetical protein [Prevotellaceae bacterium]